MNLKKDIYIIGGGAAGFFAAANLDENLHNITILEQNKDVLQKVKISGGGRCNVTHACFNPKDLVVFYPRGTQELRSVFHQFQPADTMQWFEDRGVPLKIESDNRVFPESNSSESIIKVLQNEVQKKNLSVKTQQNLVFITPKENKYLLKTSDQEYVADIVIYTTGSSPKSLKILENLGHQLIQPVPSLFTFNIKNDFLEGLMGTSFEQVHIKIPAIKLEETGPMLITHWGISGPAVLKLSAWGARKLADLQYHFEVWVNFVGMEKTEVEEQFLEYKQQNPKKRIGSSKIFGITNRFWQRILEISKVDSQKNLANLNQKEIQTIVENLCENKMQAKGKSTYKDEFVTAGGIDLKEINFKTMESKILPRFYIAGEVLNIDAVTGGFNFQACWSESWIIAQHLNQISD